MKYYDGKNFMTGELYDFSVAALDSDEAESIFAYFTGQPINRISVSRIDVTSLDDDGRRDALERRDTFLEES
jgi:hypothetical protein